MAWSTPRTWVVGEVVTAAEMNTDVRDNMNFLRGSHGASIYRTTNKSLVNNTNTTVDFDGELKDSDAYHDPVTNNSRITVPTGLNGLYVVTFEAGFDVSAVGSRRAHVMKNGTVLHKVELLSAGTGETHLSGAFAMVLAAADYLELEVWQNTGGALNLVTGTEIPQLAAFLLGT